MFMDDCLTIYQRHWTYNNSSKENPSFICFVAIVVTGHTRWLE